MPVVIENPILNSPYHEPTLHFRFDANNEITNHEDIGRRESSYFLPIASPKKSKPGLFDEAELKEKKAESGHVNEIRRLVKQWRDKHWPNVTNTTEALIKHWHAEDRFRRLFCQIEALETLIFITEVAKQYGYGHDRIEKYLKEKAAEAGTGLFRVACKMATGSGKTVVMSMLIAWQVLNKRRYPHDNRFTVDRTAVAGGKIPARYRLPLRCAGRTARGEV